MRGNNKITWSCKLHSTCANRGQYKLVIYILGASKEQIFLTLKEIGCDEKFEEKLGIL